MNPNLLLLPAFVCLTIGAYLAWSVVRELRAGALSWRSADTAGAILVTTTILAGGIVAAWGMLS